ncbi:MAG: ornithine cyclodeaminase family protein [Betaproteobacteria bacterium]|nr:ornithine cyclodeaminase family protein [Betaproteobacteria bacterium]
MSKTAISIRLLSRAQVEALNPNPDQLVEVVASGLAAHGRKEVVMPPKGHLHLDHLMNGHFNILSAWVGPARRAGIKVIGDYVDNWKHGLPSEVGVLTLYDPAIGVPLCIMDATSLTWQRTGAVTCAGAMHLAKKDSKVVAHIGARGTAFSNLQLLARKFALTEVRINSARPESRERLAARVRSELGLKAVCFATAAEACAGADIIVEATRLEKPEMLIPAAAVKPGALVVTYGWMMALDPAVVSGASKVVVDDWAQCKQGGALHPMIVDGRLSERNLHAEIGQVVAGLKPGREAGDGTIVFWHRGFAVSDVVLGNWIYERAVRENVGTLFPLLEAGEE